VGLARGLVTHSLSDVALPGARPRHRRFRVYNVGIAKTGTQSVASIFANYRSLHELLFPDTVETIARRAKGTLDESAFREFVRWRDGLARLDVDSSSYNAHYVDVLADEFPDAKFIFVIRDCWSWLDSMLNMGLQFGKDMPDWMIEHCRTILGPEFAPRIGADLPRRMPSMAQAGLSYWSWLNEFVVKHLPTERSIVVRTAELSTSLNRLAAFVGVPEETLRHDLRHVHRGQVRYHSLQMVNPRVLLEYAAGCRGLMQDFFPGVSLEKFLQQDAAA
jgi:Sulfotransferase domain